MKVAYTAGPYRAKTTYKIGKNIRNAEAVALELWKMGFAVICPHKNTALFDGECPDSVWLDGALELMYRSDLVVLCPGWETSHGTLIERDLAYNSKIPVFEWPVDAELLREQA